jgi:hypothetical protein
LQYRILEELQAYCRMYDFYFYFGFFKAEPMDQTLENSSKEEDSKQSKEPSKPVIFKDECTAFLSNVAFEVCDIIPSQSFTETSWNRATFLSLNFVC